MIEISVLFIRACTMLSKLHNVDIHEVDTSLNYPFVVHVNGPLSFVKLYNKFIKFNRNTTYVISEKIKNLTGDHERHSEFA